MIYKKTFSLLFSCQFFLVFSSGSLPNDERKIRKTLSSIGEIKLLLDNETSEDLINKLRYTSSEEEAQELIETSMLHIIESDKNWVSAIYDEKVKNLASLLGFCAGLSSETENIVCLKTIYSGLKSFLETLEDERPDCSQIFSEHVSENKFVSEPIKTLATFLYFYLYKVNKDYKTMEAKLRNMATSFAYFINEDEENLFETSAMVFGNLSKFMFYPNYKRYCLDEIFSGDIFKNPELFKKFSNLTRIYLQFLIKLGANVNNCDHQISLLAFAVKHNYLELVNFLISNGADINFKCQNRHCVASDVITFADSPEMLQLLLKHDVNCSGTCKDGYSILYFIISKIYFFNVLKSENVTDLRFNISKYKKMIKMLMEQQIAIEPMTLIRHAAKMLVQIDSTIYDPEFKKIVLEECSLEDLKSLILK